MPTSIFIFLLIASFPPHSKSACARGCDLALGSYYVSPNLTLSFIYALFSISPYSDILPYNPLVSNKNSIQTGSRVNVPFPCDCINGEFLGSTFNYVTVRDDTYDRIASDGYANLTTTDLLVKFNSYPRTSIPKGGRVHVTVDCFCGDQSVSMDYGLFVTHPLRVGDSLTYLADLYSFSGKEDLLQRYNPGKNFSAGDGIVFIPTTDPKGSYHPLTSSKTSRLSGGDIAGIVVAGAVGLLVFVCLSVLLCRRKKAKLTALSASQFENMPGHGLASHGGTGGPFPGITVDKSVEFSYEELAKATNDFDFSNKIGEGGFGAVYYAELRGEKTAIKKMDMHASREFLSELNVLTRVHHLNLVRLIGFCTESSLFLVYEYVDNGNLNEHLCGSGARDPLSWSARVQIALDSARGLEYIHEHTVPVYTHRDIKSANILIDNKFHGKVADFGLAKLTDVGSSSLQTRLVGTFGYMPPEYARYGDVSPKVDVYAFGVVLYELISAKNAIVNANESIGLVALFEGALKQQEPTEELWHLVDARLGDNYPAESVLKHLTPNSEQNYEEISHRKQRKNNFGLVGSRKKNDVKNSRERRGNNHFRYIWL